MKILGLTLAFLLLSFSAFGFGTQDYYKYTRCAQFHVDGTVASGSTISSSNDVTIPSGTMVLHTTILVQGQIVSASDNTISVGCESETDLKAATDFTDSASNSIIAGEQTADSSATYVETGCKPKAYVGSGTTGVTDGDLLVCTDLIPGKTKY